MTFATTFASQPRFSYKPNQRPKTGALPVRRSRYVTVKPEYRRSTLWVNLTDTAPLHVSQNLLDDLSEVCRLHRGLQSAPFRFRVLGSQLKGTFSLGGDLKNFVECISRGDRATLRKYARDAVAAIYENTSGSGYRDMCTMAVVAGEAQGGGFEAALSNHVLIAEKGTYFGFPEGLFGMFPGMGGERLLIARVGHSVAKKVIGSARRWCAEELFELGIVDVLADPGCGNDIAKKFIAEADEAVVTSYKARFDQIYLDDLVFDVERWVSHAFQLSERNLKTMQLIIKAQDKARRNRACSPSATERDLA